MEFELGMKQIVLSIKGRNGDTFAAVKYPDRTCGMEVNGERIGCFIWPLDQTERCEHTVRKMAFSESRE